MAAYANHVALQVGYVGGYILMAAFLVGTVVLMWKAFRWLIGRAY